jgi:predicted small secreted protein
MKIITVLLLCCFLFNSCLKKEHSSVGQQKEKKQDVLSHGILEQEIQKPDASYVFDIESFRFLDEFPWPISEIKKMYPDEAFEEKTSTSGIKGLFDENWYSLESQNITFDYLGETIDEAILYVVEIFTPKYQCNTMQIIGMPVKDLESLSGKKLDRDKKINISNDLYVLSITTDGKTVKAYTILRQL